MGKTDAEFEVGERGREVKDGRIKFRHSKNFAKGKVEKGEREMVNVLRKFAVEVKEGKRGGEVIYRLVEFAIDREGRERTREEIDGLVEIAFQREI